MKIQINATNINIKIDDGRGNTLLEVQIPAYKLDCDITGLIRTFTELAELIPPAVPAAAAGSAAFGRLEEIERDMIQRTLEAEGGNISAAARRLGITRNTLYRKLGRF